MALFAKSFAKINLYLEIDGKQKGYHLLDSLFYLHPTLCDEISIEAASEFSLEVINNFSDQKITESPGENIISKSVNLLAEKFSLKPNIKITLRKNIPISAGLGGGSGNAATTILLLNQFFNLNLSWPQIYQIAEKIGSDVPFFIFCAEHKTNLALVSGRGEILRQAPIKKIDLPILLINPGISLSTKEIFTNFKLPSKPPKQIAINFSEENFLEIIKNRKNDLEKVAKQKAPKISQIISFLQTQAGCQIARMTGSGATCFGVFDNKINLKKAKNNLKENYWFHG